jgi:hypothetical protein
MKIPNIPKMLLTFIPILLSGCISATIAGSGKSLSHLEDPKVSVGQVRQELGGSIYSRTYRPASRIKDTPEYRARDAEYPDSSPVIFAEDPSSRFSYGEDRVVSLCEVYQAKGWYAERDTQAYGMLGAMTLGVGDIAMIPSTLERKNHFMKNGFPVTFWYDKNGMYVATYHGDIATAR